jgi:hypothetical protein
MLILLWNIAFRSVSILIQVGFIDPAMRERLKMLHAGRWIHLVIVITKHKRGTKKAQQSLNVEPFLCLFFVVTLPFSIGFWAKAAQNRSKPLSPYHKFFIGERGLELPIENGRE